MSDMKVKAQIDVSEKPMRCIESIRLHFLDMKLTWPPYEVAEWQAPSCENLRPFTPVPTQLNFRPKRVASTLWIFIYTFVVFSYIGVFFS